jgi:hypothetical protein
VVQEPTHAEMKTLDLTGQIDTNGARRKCMEVAKVL